MTPDEFRRHGHDVVEWIAAYMERVGDLPIVSTVAPGDIRARLPDAAPEAPEPFDALLRDLDEIVLPGITHWQAPGWFAYFPANASPPSILAELRWGRDIQVFDVEMPEAVEAPPVDQGDGMGEQLTVEDLIAAAINDAVKRIEESSRDALSGLTAGMKLPEGFKFPF